MRLFLRTILLMFILLLVSGCTLNSFNRTNGEDLVIETKGESKSVANSHIERVINQYRDKYDICYDHDVSNCEPFF